MIPCDPRRPQPVIAEDADLDLPVDVRTADPILCKPCMDWSERRFHLGGAVGRSLLEGFLAKGWVRPEPGARALTLTSLGLTALDREFGVAAGAQFGTP